MDEQVIPTKKPVALTAFATAGWVLFIATATYSYFVYGVQQYTKGAAAGAQPASMSSLNYGIVASDVGQEKSEFGTIQTIAANSMELKVGNRTLQISLTSQTTVSAVQVQVLPESGADAGGVVTETPVAKELLKAGDAVQVTYMTSEAGVHTATKVVRQ